MRMECHNIHEENRSTFIYPHLRTFTVSVASFNYIITKRYLKYKVQSCSGVIILANHNHKTTNELQQTTARAKTRYESFMQGMPRRNTRCTVGPAKICMFTVLTSTAIYVFRFDQNHPLINCTRFTIVNTPDSQGSEPRMNTHLHKLTCVTYQTAKAVKTNQE